MTWYFYCVQSSVALWICGIVFLVKVLIEIWGQDTPTWACPGNPWMFLLMYTLGWPYALATLGYCHESVAIVFPYRDVVAVIIYLFGSAYSLGYEVHRFRWKATLDNKGKLYTIGLGQYCMHPNYFGDLFTYSGWALASGTIYAFSLVLTSLWYFFLFIIPNSQEHLAKRYPTEFPAYAASTPKLIPFVHSDVIMQVIAWISLAGACWCGMDFNAACGL